MDKNNVFTTINNEHSRAEMLKAMDIIVCNLNDEEIIFHWLQYGIPDGTYTNDEYEEYIDDDCYDDIVDEFNYCMRQALNDSK